MKEFLCLYYAHNWQHAAFTSTFLAVACISFRFFNHDNPYWSDIGKAKFDQSLACNSFKTMVTTASVAD